MTLFGVETRKIEKVLLKGVSSLETTLCPGLVENRTAYLFQQLR